MLLLPYFRLRPVWGSFLFSQDGNYSLQKAFWPSGIWNLLSHQDKSTCTVPRRLQVCKIVNKNIDTHFASLCAKGFFDGLPFFLRRFFLSLLGEGRGVFGDVTSAALQRPPRSFPKRQRFR